MHAQWLLCLTVCNPMHCGPPGSSVGFFRKKYWSGLPFPPPGDLPHSGMEPSSPTSPAHAEDTGSIPDPGVSHIPWSN